MILHPCGACCRSVSVSKNEKKKGKPKEKRCRDREALRDCMLSLMERCCSIKPSGSRLLWRLKPPPPSLALAPSAPAPPAEPLHELGTINVKTHVPEGTIHIHREKNARHSAVAPRVAPEENKGISGPARRATVNIVGCAHMGLGWAGVGIKRNQKPRYLIGA